MISIIKAVHEPHRRLGVNCASLGAFVVAQLAFVTVHAVAARAAAAQAVDAQTVAHGTAADGVFPPVSPLALQRATSSRVVAAEEAADEAVVALVAAVDVELKRLVDSRSPCTALEEAVAHYLAKVAVTDKVPANTRQADDVAVNCAYTAQVVAAQSTAAVHGTFVDGAAICRIPPV